MFTGQSHCTLSSLPQLFTWAVAISCHIRPIVTEKVHWVIWTLYNMNNIAMVRQDHYQGFKLADELAHRQLRKWHFSVVPRSSRGNGV